MPAGDFQGHVATDGALRGTAGKCGACGWSVVQLDYDEELGPLHAMYGSMEAEFEVPRTVKRPQLTTCLCFLKKVIGPIKVACRHNMNHRWSMEKRKENALIRRLAMLICGSESGKKMHVLMSREILVEVEHAKAHRSKKDKKEMSHFEKLVTKGNEKADELAKAGAMLNEGYVAQVRAKTVQQERAEVFAALQYAASFHCLMEEGKIVKSSSRSQNNSGCSWIRKRRKRNIERSGVLPASTDV